MLFSIFAPLRILYKIWFLIVFILTGMVQYPVYLLLLKLNCIRTIFILKSWFWVPLLQVLLFLPVWRNFPRGFRFPDGPFVVCANHSSYLDIVMMYTVIRDRPFIFLGKESLKKLPIIGMFFKSGNLHVPIKRENKNDSSQSLQIIAQRVDQGYPVIIFPEGTQTKNPPFMNPFKAGAFKVAIEKQVPIVPMTFLNNYKMLSQLDKIAGPCRPGISRVIVHQPIPTKGMALEDLLTLQEKVYAIIEQDLRQHYPQLYKL